MYVCCIKPFKFDTFPEFGVFVCFYVWLQYFAFVAPMFLLLSFLFFFSCFYIRCLLCALLLTDKSTEKKAKKRISIFFCRESQFFFKISSVWRYVNFVLDKKNSVDFYGLFALVWTTPMFAILLHREKRSVPYICWEIVVKTCKRFISCRYSTRLYFFVFDCFYCKRKEIHYLHFRNEKCHFISETNT